MVIENVAALAAALGLVVAGALTAGALARIPWTRRRNRQMIIVPALRTLAQVLLGYVLTVAVSHGVHIPLQAQSWFVETVMVGGGVAVYTALVRWLETNKVYALRLLGHILMMGLGNLQPVGYDTPGNIAAQQDTAGDHSADGPDDSDPASVRPDLPVQ